MYHFGSRTRAESETNDGIIMPKESRAMKPRRRFTAFDLVIKDVMPLQKDTEKEGKIFWFFFVDFRKTFSPSDGIFKQ